MDKMNEIIKIEGLRKRFGDNEVLKGITTSVRKGEVVAIIGPSGCGKSTFLRSINLLEEPTEGKVFIDDMDITSSDVDINRMRQRVGMVFQQFNLFPNMTIRRNIMLAPVELGKMTREEADEKATELLPRIGLLDKADSYPDSLSGGQKQRVAIARALAMNPEVILFDEPTSALDPVGRKEILDILSSVTEETTVLFSTHVLSDVERICDHVALLHDGSIVVQGTLENLKRKGNGEKIQIEFERRSDAEACLKKYPESLQTDALTIILPKRADITMPSVMADLVSRQVPVQKLEKLEPTLEDLFLEVVEHETAPCHDEKRTL